MPRQQFGPNYRDPSQPGPPRCNFCGARYDEQVAILVASPARLGPIAHICDQCVETCMEIIVDGFREALTKGFRVAVAEQIEPAPSAMAVADVMASVGSRKCAEIIPSRSSGGSRKPSHFPGQRPRRQNHLIMTEDQGADS